MAADRQPPHIDRMETIHILRWVDRIEHARGVNLRGQRQLNEDAVNSDVGIQCRNQRQQAGFVGLDWQAMLYRSHPHRTCSRNLAVYIDEAGRVLADEHDSKAGRGAVKVDERSNLLGDIFFHRRGDRPAVDALRHSNQSRKTTVRVPFISTRSSR